MFCHLCTVYISQYMCQRTCAFTLYILDLLRKKKKVEKENSRLAALVEELKKRLSDLENSKLVNGDSETRLGKDEGVDTGAIEERVRELSLWCIGTCT